ncbi:hypothetical protein RIF29_23344 [Crotalaria pallida]|uniref:Uncharacterized protein n=1 Tax=Crotalaria pallida TaxID=3830 RepID=A0AAN9FAA1_CROPI
MVATSWHDDGCTHSDWDWGWRVEVLGRFRVGKQELTATRRWPEPERIRRTWCNFRVEMGARMKKVQPGEAFRFDPLRFELWGKICIHTVIPPSGACHHSRQQPTVATTIVIASKFYRRINHLDRIVFAMVIVFCVQGRHRQTTTVNNPDLYHVL